MLTAGSRWHCLDFLGEGRGSFIQWCSIFYLLLSITMAGVLCCAHGKAAIKPLFSICARSVLQFETFYHFKGDWLALTRGTASKGEALSLQVWSWWKPIPAFPGTASSGISDCRSTLTCNSSCHSGVVCRGQGILTCALFFPFPFFKIISWVL